MYIKEFFKPIKNDLNREEIQLTKYKACKMYLLQSQIPQLFKITFTNSINMLQIQINKLIQQKKLFLFQNIKSFLIKIQNISSLLKIKKILIKAKTQLTTYQLKNKKKQVKN
ncbi:hypothetical protein TTHERM_000780679 (macronuclear) [Tetrahymena thermophila SB210]|uniref:Transmembrane protein n=1 Tax=Tetrahymena thermophila (strain SB210) TaxID=312017 RepID=W7XCB8_TETTS|nr:hypothetical protein TTHERM_000780679 [Tetrahymena thermophila SB210]EWS71381.1 hypothetical protein TTHERM_000780679 [Tetrahymena thermophila SB210]|eukprot:XP_012656082.1 hypothetical protein TTHERM_000780679 [Tetrahymena thermophila SB210]